MNKKHVAALGMIIAGVWQSQHVWSAELEKKSFGAHAKMSSMLPTIRKDLLRNIENDKLGWGLRARYVLAHAFLADDRPLAMFCGELSADKEVVPCIPVSWAMEHSKRELLPSARENKGFGSIVESLTQELTSPFLSHENEVRIVLALCALQDENPLEVFQEKIFKVSYRFKLVPQDASYSIARALKSQKKFEKRV